MNTEDEKTTAEKKINIPPFAWKLIATVIAVVITYQMTIASFVERAVSFIEKVEPIIEKVEPIIGKVEPIIERVVTAGKVLRGTTRFIPYYEKLANRTDGISDERKAILRDNTRRLLNNLSPIIDEIIKYHEKQRSAWLVSRFANPTE
ncbi:MAG: hypothetical protein V3U37_06860 [Nitrospinaceae bacterium]